MKEKFPGFDKCMAMMRSRDPLSQENGFHWLEPHADKYVNELIKELEHEETQGLRTWLRELIAGSKSADAFSFFAEQLRSNDWRARKWAIVGLKNLDTKEARRLLWDAQSFKLESLEETEKLLVQLETPEAIWPD